jgi:hypothetical protein
MKQPLLALSASLSLLLCVATVVLWVRSKMNGRSDQAMFQRGDRFWVVTSSSGQLYIETVPNWDHDAEVSLARWTRLMWIDHSRTNRRPWGCEDVQGFCLLHGGACVRLYDAQGILTDFSGPTSAWKVGAPHWFILLLVSIPLLLLLKRFMAYLKVSPGNCTRCGYDLTGNISGVCPECGTAMEGKAGT